MSQDELPPWYRAMDAFVMPSRYETRSNAVLEAMACGVPFAASRVGGSQDLEETRGGWLFESESVCSLVQVLIDMHACPDELKRRGDRGRSYVQAHYSWAASAERLEEIIRSRLLVTT
jgi:glycosyltransferase involved in cell wall biosynthesis